MGEGLTVLTRSPLLAFLQLTGTYLLRQSRPNEPVVISAYFDGDFKHYKVFSQAPKGAWW